MRNGLRAVWGAVVLVAASCGHRTSETVSPVPTLARPAPTPKLDRPVAARPDSDSPHREGSTVARGVVDGRAVLYVADEDERIVRTIDVADEREIAVTRLDGTPAQLVVLHDGAVAVAVRDKDRLDVLVPSDGSMTRVRSVEVATEPIGLALTPDDRTLLVASGWARTVSIVDVPTLSVRATHTVGREPRAVIASDDGQVAFVAHAAGGTLTSIALTDDANVEERKLEGVEESAGHHGSFELGGRVAGQGFALAKTTGDLGGRVLMPHVLAFSGDPSTRTTGYGGSDERFAPHVFNVAVIDVARGAPLAPSLVLPVDAESVSDDDERPATVRDRCLLPRAAVTFGRDLLVACLGTDVVVAYDAASTRPRQAERRRFSVAEGPTGIAVDRASARAFVWSQITRTITIVDLGGPTQTASPGRWLALGTHRTSTSDDEVVARGRKLFHRVGDERISADGRACASCHPDGRDDGLVWSTPNGPRQTPVLAGRTQGTAPYSWIGDSTRVADHLEQTIRRLGGKGLARDEREAIARYLETLYTPAPRARSAIEANRIARGAEVFASPETECATCHGRRGDEPDGLTHDVKSRAAGDKQRAFDTPSLRLAGGSAPYFHDGRYSDLRSLLVATSGKMGKTSHLAPDDLDALEAYVRSL